MAEDMSLAGLNMQPVAPQQPGWVGSPEDKQRAMNLLRMKSMNQPLDPAASNWLDQYMIWVDRNLPPVGGRR